MTWATDDPKPSPLYVVPDDEDDDDGLTPFATRVRYVYEDEDGRPTGRVEMRLVVIDATDVQGAKAESGLIDHDFHVATDAELDEWERITSLPLNDEDVDHLIRLVHRQLRELGRRRKKVLGEGGPPFRGDIFRARIGAVLIGKLEALPFEDEPALPEVGA